MKFDYTRQFQMMERVPDLNVTFKVLRPVVTTLKRRANKFGFLFSTLCACLFIKNFLNIDHRKFASDYATGFRVLPDYITGTSFNAYRKERKQFILY